MSRNGDSGRIAPSTVGAHAVSSAWRPKSSGLEKFGAMSQSGSAEKEGMFPPTRVKATGVVETTVYVDKENWLQVGTVLKGPNDELLGAYFYRDILFNPNFAADQFQPAALTQ